MIVIDSIDFTWAQSSPNRSEPEDLIHHFITLTGIKVGHVRADGAGEFAEAKCKSGAPLSKRIAKVANAGGAMLLTEGF